MPGKPGMYLPGIPGHVVQRGINRSPCFFEEENYLFFLDCLKDACGRYDVAVRLRIDDQSKTPVNDPQYRIRNISSDAIIGQSLCSRNIGKQVRFGKVVIRPV